MTGAPIGAPIFMSWKLDIMIIKNEFYFFVILCSGLLVTPSVLQAKDKLILSTGVDFSEGDYGATSDTEIWYIPVSLKLEQSKLIYKITVPYLQITGPGNIVGVDADPSGTGNNVRTTESGLGDIIAAVTYNILPYQTNRPLVDITAKIKIPTADKSRGLGTGKIDYYIQADGFYKFSKTSAFATVGHKFYGTSSNISFQNVYYFSLGGSYTISNELSAGIIYDFREAATASGTATKELTFFTSKKLNNKKKLLGYLVKGLSDGSPDWGIGISLSYTL